MENNKYSPKKFEENIFKKTIERVSFSFENKGKEQFSIIMPPPNVTGKLHLGHALDLYYPDTILRYKKMNGFNSIWHTGMDHAGIATQSLVEKKLLKEKGKTIENIGKDAFLKEVWKISEQNKKTILKQWKKLSIMANYDDVHFTLDEKSSEIVNDSFIKLFNEGLIFKGTRLVNWDLKLHTAISDIEVEYKTLSSKFYYVKYKIENEKKYLIIATTRPETIFGDSAICVNPNDKRYLNEIGKNVINPLNGKTIKIISDEYVDMKLGTGVLKVTPAHDFNDYELGEKYNLEKISIFGKNGKLNNLCDKFEGLDRIESRKKIVDYLASKNLIEKIKDIKNNVSFSQRSGTIVEPIISEQWFLNSSFLAKKSYKILKENNIDIFPKRFYEQVIEKLNDYKIWCISRQLLWGHQIPVYKNGEKYIASKDSPGKEWKQEEDVLDTWFSSSLCPIKFGDSFDKKNSNSSMMFTGSDLIIFWVQKMIFMSLHLDNKVPFDNLILHGMIRDAKGQKMSKSKENGIDPLEMIEKWGSDSLRNGLLSTASPGLDIKFNEKKINKAWDLNNKLFNTFKLFKSLKINNESFEDLINVEKYIFFKMNDLKLEIENNIEKFNMSIIYESIRNFTFKTLSSFYMEILKDNSNEKNLKNAKIILKYYLKLIHPFIPNLSQKIYSEFEKEAELVETDWPKFNFIDLDKNMIDVFESVHFSLNKAKTYQNDKNQKIKLFIVSKIKTEKFKNFINLLNKKWNIEVFYEMPKEATEIVLWKDSVSVFYEINNEKNEISMLLNKAKDFYNFEINRAEKMLSNKKFLKNAKEEVLNQEKLKLKNYL